MEKSTSDILSTAAANCSLKIFLASNQRICLSINLSKQRNRLNLEMRGDLRLKLTNFQPNINAPAAAHQTHPSH
ncbi:hypothetical protein T09_3306 [Trichinella sp. T9]|nr:hypothetical protein T09_3306 [Trichinella sp. T9]